MKRIMVIEELEDLIKDIEHWHRIRGALNRKRAREDRKSMVMGTLPSVLQALNDYRDLLSGVPENMNREWTIRELLDREA